MSIETLVIAIKLQIALITNQKYTIGIGIGIEMGDKLMKKTPIKWRNKNCRCLSPASLKRFMSLKIMWIILTAFNHPCHPSVSPSSSGLWWFHYYGTSWVTVWEGKPQRKSLSLKTNYCENILEKIIGIFIFLLLFNTPQVDWFYKTGI